MQRRAQTTEPNGQRSTIGRERRPVARGKFLLCGGEKLHLRGVTYGTFAPGADGIDYPEPAATAADFALMAETGINAVRTYTVPPRWLLDLAAEHGLGVMVGLAWEQHVAFLDERERRRSIERRIREGVASCAGHPAVLCFAVGNEIPASIVRWYGRRRVERFVERLCDAAKDEDADALVTYVNYPSTEYLEMPFLDLVSFNVFLEEEEQLEAYLARLQNLAGDRPLVLTELGLDSLRHGEEAQAIILEWQLRTAFAAGCAGTFVFSWTDEWHRGGYDVEDWAFGLTDRERRPKAALAAVRQAFADVPFPDDVDWPWISVVVCSHNGAATIRECLEGILALHYPNYEVIVVDDGSTDETAAIAARFGVRVIRTPPRGLSSARNTGLEAATGEIVAYLDDDVFPDRDWLSYLAYTFTSTRHAGVGGPNVPPPDESFVAQCVARAPGGPVHVLLTDREAEHIPGCNMAFRREALEAIGGFDPQFRAAGDDVDVCWRLQSCSYILGFSPAAMVWHRRRGSVCAYIRQQRGYGTAEALLERKWPERYNVGGHVSWGGRLYGRGLTRALSWRPWRIYYGTWGTGLFQSAHQGEPGLLASLPLMPEWYLVMTVLGALSALGTLWRPLLLALPALAIAVAVVVGQACLSASKASFNSPSRLERLRRRALTTLLHLVQPVARLWGRFTYGLTPWRRRGTPHFALPVARTQTMWSERWNTGEARLEALEGVILARGGVVRRGSSFDRWELQVRGGMLGTARVRLAVEEHGAGKQLLRFRSWPRISVTGLVIPVFLCALSIGAALQTAWAAAAILGVAGLGIVIGGVAECGAATTTLYRGLEALAQETQEDLMLVLQRRMKNGNGSLAPARAGET